ncbi:Sister Chromatid Cohesion Protein Pds5 A [Manis pentadactyla]|nr:Sister Chromatid Cohesion Protein Pds5 A [Manis pentadactyla]
MTRVRWLCAVRGAGPMAQCWTSGLEWPDAQEPSVTGILQPLHSPVSAQRRQPRLRHKDGDPGLRGALPGKRRRNPSAGA